MTASTNTSDSQAARPKVEALLAIKRAAAKAPKPAEGAELAEPSEKKAVIAPKARSAAIRGRFRRDRAVSSLAAMRASPAYAFATFLHLLLLVGLSFWTIATHLEEERQPVEVKLVRNKKVVPVTAGLEREEVALDALMDASNKELQNVSESETNDPFHEARGVESGEVNVFGVGGGGASGVGRGGTRRSAGGASKSSKGSMKSGLDWLARHRNREGLWTTLEKHRSGREVRGQGNIARTGLALLCFTAAGYGPDREHRYSNLVETAQTWLIDQVTARGAVKLLGGPSARWYHCYEQAIATLALSECLALKKSAKLERAVRRAVGFIQSQQTRGAGWRYTRGETDTSVTSWMVLALKSAEHAGVPVKPRSYEGVRAWLKRVSTLAGTTGYSAPSNPDLAMNATGLFLRITLGEPPTTPMNRAAARLVSRHRLQVRGGSVSNFYGIYYSALAMYQVGGEQWRKFNPLIRDAVVSSQRKGRGCERGSWRAEGHLADPVLSTTFGTLTLETYYRYMPVHQGTGDEGEDEDDAAPVLTPGESQLDVATVAMMDARTESDGGAILAAEAAYTRALRTLKREGAAPLVLDEARARLVEVAMIAKDHDLTLARIDDYMQKLAVGAIPDPAVLRLRRLEHFRRAIKSANAAFGAEASDAERLEARRELEALLGLLSRELPDLEASSKESDECGRLLAQAEDALTRIVFAVDPDKAIHESLQALGKTSPEGPIEAPERRLLVALLLRAHQAYTVALEEKALSPFKAAESDLQAFRARDPRLRMRRGELERITPILERIYLARAGALLALGEAKDSAKAARAFEARFPESAHMEQAHAIERGALASLVRSGEASREQRRRMADLIASWSSSNADLPPEDSLALGDLLLAAGNLQAARAHYVRCVTQGARMSVENGARVGLAMIARRSGAFDEALEHLDAVRGRGRDRLDVSLERCRVWRGQGKAEQAVAEYLKLLRALNRTNPEHAESWWGVAEQLGQAYLEAGDLESARAFLEEARLQDRTFGGDPARRERFIQLMRKLDAR